MATSTVSSRQGWDTTVDHAPLTPSAATTESWDTTANHVPAQPSGSTDTLATYLPRTSSKLARNLNLQNTLDAVGEIDNKLGQGDYAGAWESIKGLVPGIIAHPLDTVHAVYQKAAEGDYSGATADLITHALVLHGAFEGVRGVMPESARAAVSETVNKGTDAASKVTDAVGPYAAGVKAAAPAVVRNLPVVGKPVGAALDAFTSARDAYTAARAQQARDALVAQSRANPRSSLAEQAGIQPGGPTPIPTVQPIAPDIAALRAKLEARMQQNQAANAPAAEAGAMSTPSPPAEDTALLDDIARGQTGKSFAKLDPKAQAMVRSLAQRVTQGATPAAEAQPPAPTSLATAPSQTASAPVPAPGSSVSPPAAVVPAQQTTSLLDLLKNPEYYPPTAPKHIPTPAELGHGVYGESLPAASSVLGHLKAENEKAFNAADYAFSQGITDPAFLDKLDQQAMNDAVLRHGRQAGNPTPKTVYRRGLDEHTLTLAKAHLAKMAADAPQSQIAAP